MGCSRFRRGQEQAQELCRFSAGSRNALDFGSDGKCHQGRFKPRNSRMGQQKARPHVDSLPYPLFDCLPGGQGIKGNARIHKALKGKTQRFLKSNRFLIDLRISGNQGTQRRARSIKENTWESVALAMFRNSEKTERSCFLPGSIYCSNFWIPLVLDRKQ